MQKRLLPFLSLLLVIWGCGEAGIQSDISKNVAIDPVSVSLSVPPIFVGQRVNETPPQQISTDLIDISDNEFSDYLSDAESFTVNKISYTIENFPNGSEADLDLNIDLNVGGGTQDLLDIVIVDAQNNVDDVILYQDGVTSNVSESAITAIEQAIFNNQSFRLDIELIGRDVLLQQSNVDFRIIFKFDVTARVRLD